MVLNFQSQASVSIADYSTGIYVNHQLVLSIVTTGASEAAKNEEK